MDEHHDYVMAEDFHRIKACILYPCGCTKPCRCKDLRARTVLALNVGLYNQIEDKQMDQPDLLALKYFLQIPDDRFIRRNLEIIHTPDFIQDEFKKKEKANHFRIVDRLVWTLLRLGATHLSSYYCQPWASFNEAVGMILGKAPLARKRKQGQEAHLCGEKGYAARFKTYKSVCHFIAAFRLVDPLEKHPCFTLTKPAQIKKFFNFSHQLRTKLLELETRNTKEKYLFAPGSLIPLPDWADGRDIHIPIVPFADRLRELNKLSQDAEDASPRRILAS